MSDFNENKPKLLVWLTDLVLKIMNTFMRTADDFE